MVIVSNFRSSKSVCVSVWFPRKSEKMYRYESKEIPCFLLLFMFGSENIDKETKDSNL